MVTTQEIRRAFIERFRQWQHAPVPSSPVVPHDDPTLLFTNAGMNQFKDVFLGRARRDYRRAVTAQKCIRVGGKHNDLDNVGHTSRHLTFFEMLGNFSFGDYFKEQAIAFAWEVATQVFGFDPERIWATVFYSDDESFELWKKWLPEARIVRFGEAENFWAMGDTGPCGPCSELLYDRGPQFGTATHPKDDPSGERFLEFWNLVFMQYNRDEAGELVPLPHPAVDTGAGLERVMSLIQGHEHVFNTDILRGIIGQVEIVSGQIYDESAESAAAFRVIADHLRMLAFAIADGAQPSNTDRGYVLRKILRRAVRYGRQIGLDQPFLAKVLPRLIALMGNDYPELAEASGRIAEIVTLEEEAFLRTLHRGGHLLMQVIDTARQTTRCISGDDAFKLKDTYGLPLEEILLLAKDSGLSVDEQRFEQLDQEARERSRTAHRAVNQEAEQTIYHQLADTLPATRFVGYDGLSACAKVLAILVKGEPKESLEQGQSGVVILDQTPFYAELGGQIGDTGWLDRAQGLVVHDTQQVYTGLVGHYVEVREGRLAVAENIVAQVDAARRALVANNHTATHLLHWALCAVLGDHVRQAGSVVDSDRLRFDFSHHKALSAEELLHIEDLVNAEIRRGGKVSTHEVLYTEVQGQRDVKQFFGDKYGEHVRVVDIGCSKELCGGTHAEELAHIQLIKIVKESSIAAGVRRIEAVTGQAAIQHYRAAVDQLTHIASHLKTSPAGVIERLQKLQDESKQLERALHEQQQAHLLQVAQGLVHSAISVDNVCVVMAEVEAGLDLKELAEKVADLLQQAVVVLAKTEDARVQLLALSRCPEKHSAAAIIKALAPCIGGGGGGRPALAQAGGTNPSGITAAFDALKTHLDIVAL